MKRNDSTLFAEIRSVEKIMVLTSWPWAVPNPVRMTTPRQPLSGVLIGEGISAKQMINKKSEREVNRENIHDFDAWRILVPLNRTAFLWAPSTSSFSEGSKSWIDSFNKGVDSPDSIASFTIQVPLTRSMSAGTVVSVLRRARMIMRGRRRKQFLELHTNRNYISRK